jgi:Cupin domain
VNGEKTIMEYGDFVVTPQWAWHDHGNETDRPMFWLDGLDIPLVQFLDASFAEMLGEDAQPVTRLTGQSAAEYGNGLMPVDADHASLNSPIFNYPYARSLEALDAMRKGRDPDPCHGWKLRYTNPLTGGDAMPTMATFIQRLAPGATTPCRATDATLFVCTERGPDSRASARRRSPGDHVTFSSRRPGHRSSTRSQRRPCCSRIPTARCRRNSVSGASAGATPDVKKRAIAANTGNGPRRAASSIS